MKKTAFIINGHLKYPFSEGALNASLTDKADAFFRQRGYETTRTVTAEPYNVTKEIEKFKRADVVFLQTPINWMGAPWSLKKYIDDVGTHHDSAI
jgi:modulator of drug activity B